MILNMQWLLAKFTKVVNSFVDAGKELSSLFALVSLLYASLVCLFEQCKPTHLQDVNPLLTHSLNSLQATQVSSSDDDCLFTFSSEKGYVSLMRKISYLIPFMIDNWLLLPFSSSPSVSYSLLNFCFLESFVLSSSFPVYMHSSSPE